MVAATLLAAVIAAPTPTPNPYVLFEKAQAYFAAQHYPPYLSYNVGVALHSKVEHYPSAFDATTDTIYASSVSDYESAHPIHPHGINLCGLIDNIITRCFTSQPTDDFLVAPPELTPTYTFGIVPFEPVPKPTPESSAAIVLDVRRQFHDPYPVARKPLPMPTQTPHTIAHVYVDERAVYAIAFIGVENVNGHECYHIALTPLRDPRRNRLREMWVDERTGATWRLVVAYDLIGNRPWVVDFAPMNGVQYIADETNGLYVISLNEITATNELEAPDYSLVDDGGIREP